MYLNSYQSFMDSNNYTCTVVSDVIIFTIIVLADIPLPDWIYPFIFYIQVEHALQQWIYICFVCPGCSICFYCLRLFHVLLLTSLKSLFQLED